MEGKEEEVNVLLRFSSVACLLVCLGLLPVCADESVAQEIDRAVWSVVSRTVIESDIEGMAAVYHEDGVLVGSKGPVPISRQLAKWGHDMEQAKLDGESATVSFRFTHREHGDSAAFESGMFHYAVNTPSDERTSYYIPFEALLVKKEGRWLILMERQLEAADAAAWAALE